MSVVSPIIANWMEQGLDWTYSFEPKRAPLSLAPGQKLQVPSSDRIFKAAEGTLIQMTVFYDSVYGGMSMQADPNIDFGDLNSVQNSIVAGNVGQGIFTYATAPPITPPGVYSLQSIKEWPWKDWCKLFVINTSATQSIELIGYSYIMAYLVEEKPLTDELYEAADLIDRWWPHVTPELKETMRKRLKKVLEKNRIDLAIPTKKVVSS